MARPNYGAVKRTKELKKKAKREAKLARKHARKAREDEAAGATPGPTVPDAGGGSVEGAPGSGVA